MPPRQAASEGMRELSGAVVAMSIVLMAVFLPVAFFPVLPDRYINSLVSRLFHRDLYLSPHPRSFPLRPTAAAKPEDNVEDAACSVFGRAINWF